MHEASQCPTPQCMVTDNSPTTTSEPEPEPEPEPEAPSTPAPPPVSAPAPSTPAPTPAFTPAPPANGMTCKAVPGLNRGVSDAACARCETGYQWWPCNDAALCECDGAALAQVGANMEPKRRTVRKHGFLQT